MPRPPVTGRPAASLIELMVVVGVLGLLVGLTASAVQAVRGAAARLSCSNNLRQLGLAAQNYESAHGTLPPGTDRWPTRHGWTVAGWPLTLLPHLDQQPLWENAQAAYFEEPVGVRTPPHVGLATVVKMYTCPADGRLTGPIAHPGGYTAAYLSYAGVTGGYPGAGAMVPWRGVRPADVTDGMSQTLLLGERPPGGVRLANNWYTVAVVSLEWEFDGFRRGSLLPARSDDPAGACQPPFRFGPGQVDNRCDTHHFWSLHGGGANFALCDGGVRFLPYSARDVLPALATRAGGEMAAVPE